MVLHTIGRGFESLYAYVSAEELKAEIEVMRVEIDRAKASIYTALNDLRLVSGELVLKSLTTNNVAPRTAVNLMQTADFHIDMGLDTLFNVDARLREWSNSL